MASKRYPNASTTTEAQLRSWALQGLSQRGMAKRLDRPLNYVSCACSLLGIKTNGHSGSAASHLRAQMELLERENAALRRQLADENATA